MAHRFLRGAGPALALFATLTLVAAPGAAVDLVLSGMTYVGSQAGEADLVLSAEHARIAHDGDVAHLEGVGLEAADAAGGTGLVLTCERAELNLTTSDFTADGDVRGRTADGHRFRTDAADFHHATRTIESRAPVDIIDPTGTRLEGEGFRYDVRAGSMWMRNAVVSEIVEEPSP